MVAPEQSPATVLRERLAAYAHEAWAGWMSYLWSKSTDNTDGSVTIPPELVTRWRRQTDTVYAELPPSEQKSDLDEADKMLALLSEPLGDFAIGGSPATPFEGVAGAVAMYYRDERGLHLDWVNVQDLTGNVPPHEILAAAWHLLVGRAARAHRDVEYRDQPLEWHREWIQQHAMLVMLPVQYDRESLHKTLGAINSLLMSLPTSL